MAGNMRRLTQPTLSGRVRSALRSAGAVLVAALVCALWLGLAMPALALLPGLGGIGDHGISISLQSALLGIDNGGGPPPPGSATGAAFALGLNPSRLAVARGGPGKASLVVGLRPGATSAPTPALDHQPPSIQQPVLPPVATADHPAPPFTDPHGTSKPKPKPPDLTPPAAQRSAQTVAFTSSPPSPARVGGTYAVSASASSGLAVGFSADGACTVSGSTVSLAAAGTCIVVARQAGNSSYLPAQAQQNFAVLAPAPQAQTIHFTSIPPKLGLVGTTYAVSASASSGLPVNFAAGSGSAGVCSVSGDTVSLVGAGMCTVTAGQGGNGIYLPAPDVQQSFGVGSPSLSVQSITFTSTPPDSALVGGTYNVSASTSSGLPATFSAGPSSEGVCTVDGSLVSLIGQGACTVDADQAGNAKYKPAPRVKQTFVVKPPPPGAQTITFVSTRPASAQIGDTYHVLASASSGLHVNFSLAASSAGVCTIAGPNVSVVGPGTCVIDADQPGNGQWLAAPQVQQSFVVGAPSQSVQSIAFTSTPPSSAQIGGSYSVAASASSGLPVAFSADPSSAGVCTVSGSNMSFVGVGTCTVDANQAGNASYQPAPQAQQSFGVAAVPPSSQTIGFTSAPPPGAVVGGPTYTVAATASSGLPVSFGIAPASAGVCTISGSTVSPVSAGTCVIDADQAGNGSYLAAPQAQQSFDIATPSLSVQSIQFTSTPPAGAEVGDTYLVSATASSGLPVTFSADASSVGICSVSGFTVSLDGVGTCTVDADQAGDASYQAAPQAQQSFAVAPAALSSQTITFSSTPPASALPGDSYAIAASASSGLPVAFSAGPASAGVCTVSGSTVSVVGPGTCVVDADQPGNASYLPAPQTPQSFGVGAPASSVQSITFTSSPPVPAVVGGSYAVSATASSGLPVSFAASPGSAGVCTVSGSSVSFVGAGTCAVLADQAGNASYQPAPQAQQSFTVSPPAASSQAITFTSTAPSGAVVGGPSYAISATASSGLPVSFSAAASSAGVCTVSGATVSLVGAGTCTVNANQSGNASYLPAPQAQQSFSVSTPGKSSQTITFTSTAPSGATVGGPSYAVSASASSGLPVSLSAAASSAGICTLSGSTVSFVGAGTCTINANQAGNASYNPAPQAQQSFAVAKAAQTITFTSAAPGGAVVGGPTYTVAATASSGLTVAFSIAPASAGVCTISGSTVSFVAGGTCTVNANQAGNAGYNPAPQAQQSFAVAKATQTITFTSAAPNKDKNDPPYTVTAVSSSGLAVTFSADPSSAGVCTVSGSTVSFIGRGDCTINANQAGNASYLPAAQVQQTFKVKNHTPAD